MAYNLFVGNEADNKGGALRWVNQNVTTGVINVDHEEEELSDEQSRRILSRSLQEVISESTLPSSNVTVIPEVILPTQEVRLCRAEDTHPNCTVDTNVYFNNKAQYGAN